MTKEEGRPIMNLRSESRNMSIGVYGILVVFGAFVLLLIFNPNFSCFGKRIKSPLYPVLRKKTKKERRKVQTEDYGFSLGREESGEREEVHRGERKSKDLKTQDYGFHLGGSEGQDKKSPHGQKRKVKSNQDKQSGPSGG